MTVSRCYLCDQEHPDQIHYDPYDLKHGTACPVCFRPTCRRHLSTVRWRWRDATRETDSARVCSLCRKEYRHREWDALNREWIT